MTKKKSDISEKIDKLAMQLDSVLKTQWKDVTEREKAQVYLRCYRNILKKIGPSRVRKPKTE